MSLVKLFFRKVVFPVITVLDLEKIFSSFSSNYRLILCYHGCVHIPNFSINGRHISSKQLERHFIYFKKNFNIVSLEQIFSLYRNNVQPTRKTIAITFDDGYLNNYTTVFPLLIKYSIPATFFIISQSIVDENYINWPDVLDIIKTYSESVSIEIGDEVFYRRKDRQFFSKKLALSASDYIKRMGLERDVVLSRLKTKCEFGKLLNKANKEYYRMISKEQLKGISENGLIEIGSHSNGHYNLGNVNEELIKDELDNSKKILEKIICKQVKSVAFPDGNYNNIVKDISEESGYQNLLAVSYQCTDDITDERILPRLTISNTTTHESNMIQVNLGFIRRGI